MKKLLLLFVLFIVGGVSYAQTHTISGKILDENGQGYPGAGISVKGTQTGTVSDVNGDFTVNVPDGQKSVLIIQAIGYNTLEVTETEGSMTIRLAPAAKELEGTVVTALGLKREKRDLGYSTTTVSSQELTAGEGSSALSDLQGKVAGANITSSTSAPGGDTRIVLRGEKSILKDNNAIIVEDGIILNNFDRTTDATGLAQIDFGNSANDIDPDDIESITVLSGPAAAALYGAAAANGAIVITTKSGNHENTDSKEKSKMNITYKATYTQSDVIKYPAYQTQFGQGAIYAGIVDDREDNFSWGLPFNGQLKPWGQIINGQEQVKPWVYNGNSIKDFFQHGRDLNNFISISGGSQNSTYYLSINSVNSNNVVPNTFYDRYSIRFNGTTQLNNNFYSKVNINYINTYSRVEATGQSTGSIMQSLLQIPTDIPIGSLSNLNNPFNSMDFVDANGVNRYGYFGAYAKNPYWVAQNYDNRDKTNRVLGAMTIGYKKREFDVFDRVTADVTDDNQYLKTPAIDVISVDQTALYGGNSYINPGGYQQSSYTGIRFYNDLIATYAHSFNSKFGINALIGNNVTMQQDNSLLAFINPSTNGLVIPNFYYFTNNQGPVTVANDVTNLRRYAGYADVKFNFQRELYLELTAREEWSSTLESSLNPYFYPGANAAWVFTDRLKKSNFKDKVLDYGKVRIGAASVSNDALAYANNSAGFSQAPISSAFGSIQPPFNSIPTYQIQNIFGINSLKPELTREYETGVDLSFLKDRISASFTYYDDLTHNLITSVQLPPSSGYLFEYENIGSVSNKGEEVSLRLTPIATKWGLTWDIFGTYTHNINDVVSLTGQGSEVTLGGVSGMAIIATPGHPLGTFYTAGISTYQGHPIVDPATGLPIPTATPQYFGSYQPKFMASWGTDLKYKGIRLHALFVTKQGGQFYSETKELMDFVGSAQETTINGRNPLLWTNSVYNSNTSGSGPAVYVPNTTAKYSPYNYFVNELGYGQIPSQDLVNASYVKLQELSLWYTIPQKYYNKSPFGSLEAGVFGNNLFIWTPKSNQYDDPEENSTGATSNAQGFSFNPRLSLRNYGVTIKATF